MQRTYAVRHLNILRNFWLLLKKKNTVVINDEIHCVRVGEKKSALGITIGQYSASLLMPNGDPLIDFLFNPHSNDSFL